MEMTTSDSNNPDLSWSQVKETVKLLTVSITQVERTMSDGDKSVNTLVDSFKLMVEHMDLINEFIYDLEPGNKKELAIKHCNTTKEQIQTSIVAFQFYDRLQQSLSHIVESLKGLSQIVEDSDRLYNPSEWKKFQVDIRSRFTMESEKAMFDAILQGKSIDEAIQLAVKVDLADKADDDVELF